MIKGFLVKKKEMIRKFRKDGRAIAATACLAKPCFVIGVINPDKAGYRAVQLAAGSKKKTSKALLGKAKKAKIKFNPAIIREVAVDKDSKIKLGDEISVSQVLSEGDLINATGITKGRGFAGVVKRWGFHTQPATHGQRDRERSPGSIGAQTPGKVIKGKKMPGHYGNSRVTLKNLEILSIDDKSNKILIKGAIPGFENGWLIINSIGKVKNFSPLMEKESNGSNKKENGKN